MDEIEVPQYFLCPISLQIMKDPVTTITGITYDRENIKRWLSDADKMCPVTNQPLPKDSDLTPNHTLRRLIQSWSTFNPSSAPIDHGNVIKLLDDLSDPILVKNSLDSLESIASDGESNKQTVVNADFGGRLVSFIVSNSKTKESLTSVEQAVRILNRIQAWSEEHQSGRTPDLPITCDLIESMTWVLRNGSNRESRSEAVRLLKSTIQFADSLRNWILERLKPEFFQQIVQVIQTRIDSNTTKSALQVLLVASRFGTNKTKMVKSGAVAATIEVELTTPDKRTSELDLILLDQLCSCADGREQFLNHAAGLAVVTKRILGVSPVVDEKAVGILAAISMHSGRKDVLQEMVSVGGVSKLCMVLHANCSSFVKEKARSVLRLHSGVWKDSPCVAVYLLERFP